MGLESISEPDDMDMDNYNDNEEEEAQDDRADKPFFDTRDSTRWSPTSPDASVRGGARSSDFDMEEDPTALGRLRGLRLRLGKVACRRLLMISVGRKMLLLTTSMMMTMTTIAEICLCLF
jgi:hypothetical protein